MIDGLKPDKNCKDSGLAWLGANVDLSLNPVVVLRVFASSREFRFVPHAKPRRARRIVDEVTRKEGEAAILWFEKVLGS